MAGPIAFGVPVFEQVPFMRHMGCVELVGKGQGCRPFAVVTADINKDAGEFFDGRLGQPLIDPPTIGLEEGQAVRTHAAEKRRVVKAHPDCPGCAAR